jgi:polyisoprenoid-binding protein YceI
MQVQFKENDMRKMLSLIVVAVAAVPALAQEANFALTGDNTKIEFTGTKRGGKHDGGFKKVAGTASVAGGDPTKAKIEVEIDMASTWSDDEKLTKHLLSPDFFAVKTHPKAKFVSTKVEKANAGFSVTGDLTLNGKTKSVTFPAQIKASPDGLNLSAEFLINRHDWGITYGKGMIYDDVALRVKLDAKK